MERYTRQIKLNEVGLTGQVKLSKSRVLIVGAGGLGCPVGIYLSAAGIGHISLVDHDIISTSNLNRQVLFGKADVGKLKVEVARQKMLLQNDSIDVTAIPYRIDLHNAMKLISGSDLVIDCTDNLPTRYLLSDACELANKPLVFGGIHKFQIQMSVLNHTQRISYRDINPYDDQKDRPLSCNEVGVLGPVAGILGTLQANEAIKVLLGLKGVLDGKMYVFNTLNLTGNLFSLKRTSAHIKVIEVRPEYDFLCSTQALEISVEELLDLTDFDLVDIRDRSETPDSLITCTSEPDMAKSKLVLMCQKGQRSLKAINEFKIKYPKKEIYSLKGGVLALNERVVQKQVETGLLKN